MSGIINYPNSLHSPPPRLTLYFHKLYSWFLNESGRIFPAVLSIGFPEWPLKSSDLSPWICLSRRQASYITEHSSSQKVEALAWLGVNVFMDGKCWFCILLVTPTEVILGFRDLIIWKMLGWSQLQSHILEREDNDSCHRDGCLSTILLDRLWEWPSLHCQLHKVMEKASQ